MIDEQINSVRRELNNMLKVGVIHSDTRDNKLYYEVNQRYEHYVPFRAIFADTTMEVAEPKSTNTWQDDLAGLPGIRLALVGGVLVKGSDSTVDVLIVGDAPVAKIAKLIKQAEKVEGRELNYSLIPYDEFYYRLSIRDKFITEIVNSKHSILVDTDNIL